ncbi:MAG: tRNA (guanosine(37)-N1)-methyltransferase TrmD [Desulfovibrionaceae bacterium]|nr:tRNA (guanosine(37)-N1)-methyltransferase TrmD [Desulfovibrionaceae bacterium]
MLINVITLFPEWFDSPVAAALLGKARSSGLVEMRFINPRDFTFDVHHSVDDRPYGGGPGMVMMVDPVVKALEEAGKNSALGSALLMSASGRPFSQKRARELAREACLTLICGRYEGIDDRISDVLPIEPVSVGEAVLNGGEAAAMLIIEAVTRLIPGFMGKEASGDEESFSDGLLEYPQYTRPERYGTHEVDPVLLSGNHAAISAWRRQQSLKRTMEMRPDLLTDASLDSQDRIFLRNIVAEEGRERLGRNLFCALVHYPVYLDERKTGASSLTNLDIHDIARCSRCYGVSRVFAVTPLQDQRALLDRILHHWTQGSASVSHPDRADALRLVEGVSTIDEAVRKVLFLTGRKPVLIGTSARDFGSDSPAEVRELLREHPVLLLFGTGRGLAPEVFDRCDRILKPLRWLDDRNHYPVRGAFAVTLDRILGDFF